MISPKVTTLFMKTTRFKPTTMTTRSYVWSPTANVLAVILESKDSQNTTTWSGDGRAFFVTFDTTMYE